LIEEPKAMPSAIMAEKAILSCLMQQPKRFVRKAAGDGLDKDCFYLCGTLHAEILAYHAEHPDSDEIDLVGFITSLQMSGVLDRVGGPSEIADVFNYSVNFGSWEVWARQLKECNARRIAIAASIRLAEASDSAESIQEAKATLQALTRAITGKTKSVNSGVASKAFLRQLVTAYESGDIPGHGTGIECLDQICGGMKPGELWVIGGKPSRGKSVLMLQVANAFIGRGEATAIFSLEMMANEVIGRLISNGCRVDYGAITQPRNATKIQLEKIKNGISKLATSKLWIDASSNQTVDSIMAEAEAIRDLNGEIKLVVVDYIQLIRGTRSKNETREEEIARVSGGLKQLAKHLNCPVLSATQLNEQNQTRESRAIEQDADALLYICDDGCIKIGKMRNGKRDGLLPLRLDGAMQRFIT